MIEDKYKVLTLRDRGLSYSQISEELGLSANTIKSYCHRAKARRMACRNCGKPLIQIKKQKPKTFCGSECRKYWWKNNSNKSNSKAVYQLGCRYCGRCFLSYR